MTTSYPLLFDTIAISCSVLHLFHPHVSIMYYQRAPSYSCLYMTPNWYIILFSHSCSTTNQDCMTPAPLHEGSVHCNKLQSIRIKLGPLDDLPCGQIWH